MISFCGPRGAQSLPSADFSELAALAKETKLPVLLCGDNDEPGREAIRKVRALLKMDFHVDARDLTSLGSEKSSVADLPASDLQALIRIQVSDRDPTWQKPGRNQAQYAKYKCRRPKKNISVAGDGREIWSLCSCGNTGVCPGCGIFPPHFLRFEVDHIVALADNVATGVMLDERQAVLTGRRLAQYHRERSEQ